MRPCGRSSRRNAARRLSRPCRRGADIAPALLRANALQRANLLGEIEALHPRYDEISVPVEIVHGTADTTVGLSIHSRPLADQVEKGRLTVLDGIGHMPQHADEDAVVAAIHRAATRAGLRPLN